MPQDTHHRADTLTPLLAAARRSIPATVTALRQRWLRLGLPVKLLLLTSAFVMLAEVLIFVPSVANRRVAWLNDRLTAGELATLAAEAGPGGVVPERLRTELLQTAQVKAVAVKRNGRRSLILPPDGSMTIDAHIELRQPPGAGLFQRLGSELALIGDTLAVYLTPSGRMLRVTGPLGQNSDDFVEVVVAEAPLKAVMVRYGLNILGLSIVIALFTAALVYLALSSLLVQPMMRITRNMVHFGQDPEDSSRIITPSGRDDEIGTAERELAQMQRQLSQALVQKNRLAQLGLAVSKINHDLRNMLANAQLISDRLTSLPDPTVQRFAPKLIASLDRAINFCSDLLQFGRAEEAAPRRDLMLLKPLVEETGDGLGLPREGSIAWAVDMEDTLRIDADREHLFRILSNLCRNAIQAIESQGDGLSGKITVKAWREGRRVFVQIRDTGPGVPPKARANLFVAFQASSRKGGTGLGLVIAAELVAAHGGTLRLIDSDKGAVFQIELPDRGVR